MQWYIKAVQKIFSKYAKTNPLTAEQIELVLESSLDNFNEEISNENIFHILHYLDKFYSAAIKLEDNYANNQTEMVKLFQSCILLAVKVISEENIYSSDLVINVENISGYKHANDSLKASKSEKANLKSDKAFIEKWKKKVSTENGEEELSKVYAKRIAFYKNQQEILNQQWIKFLQQEAKSLKNDEPMVHSILQSRYIQDAPKNKEFYRFIKHQEILDLYKQYYDDEIKRCFYHIRNLTRKSKYFEESSHPDSKVQTIQNLEEDIEQIESDIDKTRNILRNTLGETSQVIKDIIIREKNLLEKLEYKFSVNLEDIENILENYCIVFIEEVEKNCKEESGEWKQVFEVDLLNCINKIKEKIKKPEEKVTKQPQTLDEQISALKCEKELLESQVRIAEQKGDFDCCDKLYQEINNLDEKIFNLKESQSENVREFSEYSDEEVEDYKFVGTSKKIQSTLFQQPSPEPVRQQGNTEAVVELPSIQLIM